MNEALLHERLQDIIEFIKNDEENDAALDEDLEQLKRWIQQYRYEYFANYREVGA